MRISDWSSDVCSSDLGTRGLPADRLGAARNLQALVAADHADDEGEQWRLDDADPEGPGGDRIVQLAGELKERDVEHHRSEEHTSELQSLMRITYAVFCLKKKKHTS